MDAGRVQEAVQVAKNAFANGMQTAVHADLATGETVWRTAEQEGIAGSVFVATAAVDLYVKCGEMAKEGEVFDKMQEKDAGAWGAMVGGYASNGDLFFAMQAEGVRPDCYTVVGALSACTRHLVYALEAGAERFGTSWRRRRSGQRRRSQSRSGQVWEEDETPPESLAVARASKLELAAMSFNPHVH